MYSSMEIESPETPKSNKMPAGDEKSARDVKLTLMIIGVLLLGVFGLVALTNQARSDDHPQMPAHSVKLTESENSLQFEVNEDVARTVHYVHANQFMDDSGSDANTDIKFFKAGERPGNCYPVATSVSNTNTGSSVPCLETTDPNDVRRPSSYSKVWTDAGSGNSKDYALWQSNCPTGYVSLCDTPYFGIKHGNGLHDLSFQGVYCVRSNLVDGSSIVHNVVWTDAGTGARQDGSVWPIHRGAWAASGNHGPPGKNVYSLKSSLPAVYH